MKHCIFFIVGLLFTTIVFSQGSISGTLIEQSTGESLPFATVLLKGTDKVTQSDVDGKFKIEEVTAGSYTLIVSFVGMEDYEQPVTLAEGENLDLGNIETGENVIGLDEVEVFADFVDEQKQVSTSVTTINSQIIDEKMGAQEFTELMKSAPGVFVSTLGGSYGSSQIKIRGFGSENTAVLINGVPVNDMENGRVFWSNWGGLNDVTKNQQIQRGLGASKLAISSVGGTINIITKPTEFRKGIRASYSYSNRTWQNRYMLTSSTGLMKNGLAITASASTRRGVGFREGTQTEAYSYFLTVYKEIGERNQLMFTAFGAPQKSWGGRSATQTAYEVAGQAPQETSFYGIIHKGKINYNPAWGYRDGEKFSAAQNQYHKPMFMLNHYFDINEKFTLSTAAYYSFGKGYGTGIDRSSKATGGNPIPYQIQPGAPSYMQQIPWDSVIAENQTDTVTLNGIDGDINNSITGRESKYIFVSNHNDHKWLGAITTLNGKINETTEITVGIDWRWYRGIHYRILEDLLGGDFWIDKERFNQEPDNNLLEPRHAAVQGEKVGYNYTSTVAYGGVFAQAKKTFNKVDLFATGASSYSTFYRNGLFLHQEFLSNDPAESSLGFSESKNFLNYTLKGGVNYKINGRHNAFFNVGRFTRAPFYRNSYVDARVANVYRGGLEESGFLGTNKGSEKFFSLESGYGYRSPKLAGHANIYRTQWNNRAYIVSIQSAAYNGDFVNFNMRNVNAVHQGAEFDAAYEVIKDLKITGMLSMGDWRYNGDAQAVVLRDPSLGIVDNPISGIPSDEDPVDIHIDGLRVGGSAQTTASVGLNYRGRQRYYCGADYNFYARMFADFNPESKIYQDEYFNQVQKLPNAGTIDIYGGKSWTIKGVYTQLKFNINNVFNNQFLIDANERIYTGASSVLNGKVAPPSPFVQYYFGRTYFASVVVSF